MSLSSPMVDVAVVDDAVTRHGASEARFNSGSVRCDPN
jgi:hypothetical protein